MLVYKFSIHSFLYLLFHRNKQMNLKLVVTLATNLDVISNQEINSPKNPEYRIEVSIY